VLVLATGRWKCCGCCCDVCVRMKRIDLLTARALVFELQRSVACEWSRLGIPLKCSHLPPLAPPPPHVSARGRLLKPPPLPPYSLLWACAFLPHRLTGPLRQQVGLFNCFSLQIDATTKHCVHRISAWRQDHVYRMLSSAWALLGEVEQDRSSAATVRSSRNLDVIYYH
jgi:hypothetical protein